MLIVTNWHCMQAGAEQRVFRVHTAASSQFRRFNVHQVNSRRPLC